MDSGNRFSGWTIALHWMVALGALVLIALGIYMVQTESWSLYHLHKSLGLLLFVAILARVFWRMRNGLPEPVRSMSAIERAASRYAHVALLVLTLLLPIAGMVYSGASGNGFGIFAIEIFPTNLDPQTGLAIPFNETTMRWGQRIHSWLGYALLVLVTGHVLAALKHHFLDRDNTLVRMLGRSLRGE